jgi:hypothetical protein
MSTNVLQLERLLKAERLAFERYERLRGYPQSIRNAGQTDDVLSKSAQLGKELCLLLCKLDYRHSEKRYCAEKLSIAFSLILQLHHQIGCLFGTPLSINILAIGHLELPVRGSVNIAPAPHLAIDRFPWATSDCGEAGNASRFPTDCLCFRARGGRMRVRQFQPIAGSQTDSHQGDLWQLGRRPNLGSLGRLVLPMAKRTELNRGKSA